jgi:hypothetical protein
MEHFFLNKHGFGTARRLHRLQARSRWLATCLNFQQTAPSFDA